jgi:hypothetical protein
MQAQVRAITYPLEDNLSDQSRTVKVVSASAVPREPVRCPECHGGNLILRGTLHRIYAEELVDGKTTRSEIGKDNTHEVLEIDCSDCNILFEIQSDEVAELQRAIITLTENLPSGAFQKC